MKPLLDYPVLLIYSSEDKLWLARVDQLPGCIADGETQEEALDNAKEVIKDWICVSKKLGREIPKPFDVESLEELEAEHQRALQSTFKEAVKKAANRAIQEQLSNQEVYSGYTVSTQRAGFSRRSTRSSKIPA